MRRQSLQVDSRDLETTKTRQDCETDNADYTDSASSAYKLHNSDDPDVVGTNGEMKKTRRLQMIYGPTTRRLHSELMTVSSLRYE